MRLFSACAIVLVVVGHIPSTGFNGPFDMFKPYSFQVAAFVFVAGYFYKESHEVHPFQYLKSRIKRLLIPLVAINAAYGCLVLLLKKLVGITWGGSLCPDATSDALYRWPSVSYQHAHVVYRSFVFRRVAQFKQVSSTSLKETILLFAYLALGAIAIELGGADGLPSGWLLLVCRTLFFLACLGMGRFYARVLERYDTLPNVTYFALLLAVQLVGIAALHGRYTYIPSWCQFPGGVVGTYFVTITGIAFLMRCCKMLAPSFGRSSFVAALAGNTFSIMCHHIFGFFLVCTCFGVLSVITPWFTSFDFTAYLSDWTYRWMPAAFPQTSLVYVAGGVFVSLLIHESWGRFKQFAMDAVHRGRTSLHQGQRGAGKGGSGEGA